MSLGKILLIMAMTPMTLMAQTSSTSDISDFVEDQNADSKQERVERIEVTGSLIKRVDVEGPKPVQTLDREALDRAGYNSAGDVLRDLSANSFGSARETSGTTTAGTASVSLRGLGANRTLVLLNGRRMAKDGIGGFVDLNLIPIAAVERMEILKDSSSATYGSDAIGGVVNIITKKDFDGAELNVRHENAELGGGNRTMVSGTVGKSTAKGNAMVTFQYRENTILFAKDRPWTREGVSGNTPIPNVNTGSGTRAADNSCAGGTFNDESGRCEYNFSQFASETPEIKQFNVLSSGRYEINDSTEAYYQAQGTRKDVFWRYAPGVVRFEDTNGNSRLRGSYLQDYFGADYDATRGVDVFWRANQLGNRDTEVDETAYGAIIGGKKFIGDSWEIDAHVGTNRAEREDRSLSGYANAANLRRDLSNGNCRFLEPGGACSLGADVAYNPWQTTESRLDFAEVRASGELFELPAGAVAMAVGTQMFYETFSVDIDSLSKIPGAVAGGGAGSTGAGSRRVMAAYTELAAPLTEKLELSLAGRYDNYDDFGDTFNPAASLKYKPFNSLLLRASASTGFKAPDMSQVYQANSEGYPTAWDPQTGLVNQYLTFSEGNRDLKEERSKSLSVGAVFEPHKNFNASVDFFHVEMENVVSDLTLQDMLLAEDRGVDLAAAGTTITRDPVTNEIKEVRTSAQNLGQRKVAGYDFGFRFSQPTRVGRFGLSTNATYLIRFDEERFPGDGRRSTLQEFGQPEWRNNTSFDYAPTQDLAFQLNFITTGSHYKTIEEDGKLERFTQIDGTIAYNLRKINGRIQVGARNIFATEAPLNTSDINGQFDDTLYDPIGRRFFAAYNQTF